jgi:hypothetical protein
MCSFKSAFFILVFSPWAIIPAVAVKRVVLLYHFLRGDEMREVPGEKWLSGVLLCPPFPGFPK